MNIESLNLNECTLQLLENMNVHFSISGAQKNESCTAGKSIHEAGVVEVKISIRDKKIDIVWPTNHKNIDRIEEWTVADCVHEAIVVYKNECGAP